MSKSSSGDLYWIENQYVTANIWKFTWKRSKNEYSPHNVSVLSALKKLFCMSSNLPNSISLRRASPPGPPIPGPYPGPTSGLRRPRPLTVILCALQNGPAIRLYIQFLIEALQWREFRRSCTDASSFDDFGGMIMSPYLITDLRNEKYYFFCDFLSNRNSNFLSIHRRGST